MGWEARRNGRSYYYEKTWEGGRCVSRYMGAGEVAELSARLGAIGQETRALQLFEARLARAVIAEQARAPAELQAFAAAVRTTVAEILAGLGFHQHRRQWRMQMGKVTPEQQKGAAKALAIYKKKQPTDDDIKELRSLLRADPLLPRTIGDTALMAKNALREFFSGQVEKGLVVATAVDARCDQLAVQLGWRESSELERLLIDEIVLCWLDHHRIAIVYAQDTQGGFKLAEVERWERILVSKQARYLRAVEALARLRRLLRLPNVQINIAAQGGQQVNVAGELRHEGG